MKNCIYLILLTLLACKAQKSLDKTSTQSAADQSPARRDAWSFDDLSAVKLYPDPLHIEPWKPQVVFLSGVFPDNTEGKIVDPIEWKSSDESKAKISSDGIILPQAEGTVTISAKIGELSTEKSAVISWPHGAVKLPDAEKIEVKFDSPTLAVSWDGADPTTSFRLAIGLDEEPEERCEDEESEELRPVEGAQYSYEKSFTDEELTDVKAFHVRLCPMQLLSAGGKKISRVGEGLLRAVDK